MKKFDVKKIHGKFTSPWKKFIENSQKILIKIHLKIHAKIRTEKNSPEFGAGSFLPPQAAAGPVASMASQPDIVTRLP